MRRTKLEKIAQLSKDYIALQEDLDRHTQNRSLKDQNPLLWIQENRVLYQRTLAAYDALKEGLA